MRNLWFPEYSIEPITRMDTFLQYSDVVGAEMISKEHCLIKKDLLTKLAMTVLYIYLRNLREFSMTIDTPETFMGYGRV